MSDNGVADLIHASDMGSTPSRSELERYSVSTALKRRASPTFEGLQDATSRKRLKGDAEDQETSQNFHDQLSVDGQALLEDLNQELQCGCCAGLVYRPVTVSPCQHFLCGR
jgi:E3 ubiquitin-protein ligase CHFR